MSQFHPSVIHSRRAQRVVAICCRARISRASQCAVYTLQLHVAIAFNVHAVLRRREVCGPLITGRTVPLAKIIGVPKLTLGSPG